MIKDTIGIKQNISSKKKIQNITTEYVLLAILAVVFLLLSVTTDSFLTARNLANLVRQTSINGIIALGMTMVILTGGIDLSVGSVVGVSGILVSMLIKSGMPVTLAVIITLAISVVFGLLNGVMIHKGKLPPFIATLGTMTILRGATMLISGARMVAGLPASFTRIAQIEILGIPFLFIIWALFIGVVYIILNKTHFGRNVYAIGSSQEVARLSGINVKNNLYMVYISCAFLSAVAGILVTSRLANGIPTGGTGYEMDAIAACVVGGISMVGAEGSVLGTVLGAILMATLRNGGNLLGFDPFFLQMLIGFLIVVAVFIDQIRAKA